LSTVTISGAQCEHSFGCVLCPHFSVCLFVCLSVCRVRTLSPHQRFAPNENHKMKYNRGTSNNISIPLALRYLCLFIQKQMCNYRESRRVLLGIARGHYSSWHNTFTTSARPDCHITVTPLAIRPHARRNTDGKWQTTVVR